MQRTMLGAVACLCAAILVGCGGAPEEEGYDNDSQIGTGMDIVDGTIGGPLRALRQAQIMVSMKPVNDLIQIERIETGDVPADLDAVKALWKKEYPSKPFPEPAFRHKLVYDRAAGAVSQVHKKPEEYTKEEREGADRGPH